MPTLQQKVGDIRRLKAAVNKHPMTVRFYEQPHHYVVHLPEGSHPIYDLVRIEKGGNKKNALGRLLLKLEDLWKEGSL